MNTILSVTLALLVDGTMEPFPIAEFPDTTSCGIALEMMLHDSICQSDDSLAPSTSLFPKPRPVREVEK